MVCNMSFLAISIGKEYTAEGKKRVELRSGPTFVGPCLSSSFFCHFTKYWFTIIPNENFTKYWK